MAGGQLERESGRERKIRVGDKLDGIASSGGHKSSAFGKRELQVLGCGVPLSKERSPGASSAAC